MSESQQAPLKIEPKAVTPIAFAKAIVAAYEKYGQSPERALRLAQIAPADVLNPEARITARQMEVLSGAAMKELDDEALGAFSRRLPWGSYGMLARASISSPNLGVALKRWCRHHKLLTEDVQLKVSISGDRASITVATHDWRRIGEFGLTHVLRNIHGLACWYIDSRIALDVTRFPFAAPLHAGAYELMFPGMRNFGAPQAEICFDARYLALPLRRDEKALQQMLQRALPLTVLQYRRDRLLVEQVRQALRAGPDAAHRSADVARQLNLSVRTLHRRLAEEGSSLQLLKDEMRFERARQLLSRSQAAIKQVAQACGFGNDKSFSRAFRGWAGLSPDEFRNQQLAPLVLREL